MCVKGKIAPTEVLRKEAQISFLFRFQIYIYGP